MPEDRDVRILSLTELREGWLNGTEGDPISRETADLALLVMTSLEENPDVGDFRTYPTPDGEVQFEWEEGSVQKEVRVWADDIGGHLRD